MRLLTGHEPLVNDPDAQNFRARQHFAQIGRNRGLLGLTALGLAYLASTLRDRLPV